MNTQHGIYYNLPTILTSKYYMIYQFYIKIEACNSLDGSGHLSTSCTIQTYSFTYKVLDCVFSVQRVQLTFTDRYNQRTAIYFINLRITLSLQTQCHTVLETYLVLWNKKNSILENQHAS